MKTLLSACLAALSILIPVVSVNAGDDADPGDIVINEFMADPNAVNDTDGEWVEIANTTGSTININGWTLQDDGSDSHTINNGGPLNVAPNDYVVLCRNATSAANGGVTCNYQYSSFLIANDGDEIVLKDDGGQEIARRNYTSSSPGKSSFYVPSAKPPASGYFTDNNTDSQWANTDNAPENTYGSGDYGTPGAKNTQSGEGGTPTAVTLQSFTARNNSRSSWLLAVVLLGIGGLGLISLSLAGQPAVKREAET